MENLKNDSYYHFSEMINFITRIYNVLECNTDPVKITYESYGSGCGAPNYPNPGSDLEECSKSTGTLTKRTYSDLYCQDLVSTQQYTKGTCFQNSTIGASAEYECEDSTSQTLVSYALLSIALLLVL